MDYLKIYDKEYLSKLPFSLGHPLQLGFEAYEAKDYGKAMNHFLDFFEIASCYCSVVLFRLLQKELEQQPQVRSALENYINKIDAKRPLSFGDWLNDLFTPLIATAQKMMPEFPLTKSFCTNLYVKRRNVLLGTKSSVSIVQIRNEYRGHSTMLSDAIYQEVVETLMPNVERFVEAVRPLSECNYDVNRGHYYISFGENLRIDLYPFVMANEKDYRYVFHTLKDDKACYLSSNEDAVTYISYDMNDAIDRSFQEVLPSFDIAKDMNWLEIKKFMQNASKSYLDRAYAEKKYNQELFVERSGLTDRLKAFWKSDTTLFPLIGEAGQGKTNQLAYWTEMLIEKDAPVLTLNSADMSSYTLDLVVKDIFNCGIRKDVVRLIDSIHQKAEQENKNVYIFFDAINECMRYADDDAEDGALALYRAICRLFANEKYHRFKVLFTCRSYTWKNVILPNAGEQQSLIFDGGADAQVRGFDNETAKKAYELYQQLYQMYTPFDEIDRRVALRLKDPLALKVVSGIFLGRDLSESPEKYTTIALYNQLYEEINNSYAGNRQREILDAFGDYILEQYLKDVPADYLDVEEVRNADFNSDGILQSLSRLMYKKDGISIAYSELLYKAERPIFKEVVRQQPKGKRKIVQLVYERFFEYVLGRAIVRKFGSVSAEETYKILNDVSVANVAFIGAVRNAVIMSCLNSGSFDLFIDFELKYGGEYRAMLLVNDVLNTLVSENYEDELFALIPRMIDCANGKSQEVTEFNEVVKVIENNDADEAVIARHKQLSAELAPIVRMKKLASVSILKGMLLTDFFNEGLYGHNALDLLWKMMTDTIYDVRSDVCMYAYYLSKYRYTSERTALTENLTVKIVREMYAKIRSHSLAYNFLRADVRKRTITYLETSTRLAVLMIIDNMLTKPNTEDNERVVADMFSEIKSMMRHLSGNLYLVKLVLPVLQIVMKKQVTFQSEYVNNVLEYQTFWEEETFANVAYGGQYWSRADIKEVMKFCDKAYRNNTEEWHKMTGKLLSAYKSGDSFSYFVIERMMIIMGVNNWNNVSHIFHAFFTDEFLESQWFDYSQMSMLYVLYQIAVQSQTENEELLEIYTREALDWTRRRRGLFAGIHSGKANAEGLYKRNLMSWYSAVYLACAPKNNEKILPAFYELIDEALRNKDRELLTHLVENILEMVTDMGFYDQSLQLVKYILRYFDTQEKVDAFDRTPIARKGVYEYGIVKLMGNVLSTAKNYCPELVNDFIQKELSCMSFPGAESYQENILNFNPSGEGLQDVLTHKFGNFLIHSLIHIKEVDDFAIEAIDAAIETKNSFAWYEQVVKILIKHMFNR